MQKRFLAIWFRYLKTDWLVRRQPGLKNIPLVLATKDHGRMVITASNILALQQGIETGMMLADARAIIPSLVYFDDEQGRDEKLLAALAEWFIRYTPVVSIDLPNGLILDVTGCAHLWGGEKAYLTVILKRLESFGYQARSAIADTVGAAWAVSRFGKDDFIIKSGQHEKALLSLPSCSLRLESDITDRLEKLGLRNVSQFVGMPPSALRRRFGSVLIKRLHQALGYEEEQMIPIFPLALFEERLHSLEPIVTRTGIEIALQKLLDTLCLRLKKEEKGIRTALFKCYRIDGKTQEISIGTHRASCNARHLFKLFEDKISTIEPALGIELFVLEAPQVEDIIVVQEKLFESNAGLHDVGVSELLDRIGGKIGTQYIHRYVPAEHYWPERSYKAAVALDEKLQIGWKVTRPRPLRLLAKPEPVEVTAPVPDYPPMHFRYRGKLHKIIKSDGPERIEQEWWLRQGQHRDYYAVEDEEGCRYWIFRSGHYDEEKSYKWFMHGFFA